MASNTLLTESPLKNSLCLHGKWNKVCISDRILHKKLNSECKISIHFYSRVQEPKPISYAHAQPCPARSPLGMGGLRRCEIVHGHKRAAHFLAINYWAGMGCSQRVRLGCPRVKIDWWLIFYTMIQPFYAKFGQWCSLNFIFYAHVENVFNENSVSSVFEAIKKAINNNFWCSFTNLKAHWVPIHSSGARMPNGRPPGGQASENFETGRSGRAGELRKANGPG